MERPSSSTTRKSIYKLRTESGLLVHIRNTEQLYLLLRSAGVSPTVAFRLALHAYLESSAGLSTKRKLEHYKENWRKAGNKEPF